MNKNTNGPDRRDFLKTSAVAVGAVTAAAGGAVFIAEESGRQREHIKEQLNSVDTIEFDYEPWKPWVINRIGENTPAIHYRIPLKLLDLVKYKDTALEFQTRQFCKHMRNAVIYDGMTKDQMNDLENGMKHVFPEAKKWDLSEADYLMTLISDRFGHSPQAFPQFIAKLSPWLDANHPFKEYKGDPPPLDLTELKKPENVARACGMMPKIPQVLDKKNANTRIGVYQVRDTIEEITVGNLEHQMQELVSVLAMGKNLYHLDKGLAQGNKKTILIKGTDQQALSGP